MTEPTAAPAATPAPTTAAPGTEPAATPSLINSLPPEGTSPPGAEAAESPPAADPPAEVPLFSLESVKLPEGLVIPEAVGTEFTELMNTHKVPAEAAQGLLDLYAKQVAEQTNAGYALWEKTNSQWQEEVKADKVIGGDKLPQTLASIAKLIDHPEFADPGLRQALDMTGAGNNPSVVRLLAKLANKFGEGNFVAGTAPAAAKARPQTFGEALYGSSTEGNN